MYTLSQTPGTSATDPGRPTAVAVAIEARVPPPWAPLRAAPLLAVLVNVETLFRHAELLHRSLGDQWATTQT